MSARADAAPISLRSSRKHYGEKVIQVLLGLCALISILTTLGIVVSLLFPALEFFAEVSPVEFFTGTTWAPLFEPASFGAVPLLVGTLVGHLLGAPRRDPARPRFGDLPERVRERRAGRPC